MGKPLYADFVTEEGTRLYYARICVEIVVDSYCPESIDLSLPNGEKTTGNLEFSRKPLKCSKCKCFGHATKDLQIVTEVAKPC